MVGKRHLQNTWLPLATDHLLCATVPAILRPLHWLPADRCGLVAAHQQHYVVAAAWHGSRLHGSSCLNQALQHGLAA